MVKKGYKNPSKYPTGVNNCGFWIKLDTPNDFLCDEGSKIVYLVGVRNVKG